MLDGMRSFKSIERPAQVLGMNLPDLGLAVGLFLAAVLAVGIAGLVVSVPRVVYLVVVVAFVATIYGLRYLAKHRPPGFLLGWLSFRQRQPRRIALGRSASPDSPTSAYPSIPTR